MAKKVKQLTTLRYFLDHPQIKRHHSPGNGALPGTPAVAAGSKAAQGGQPNPDGKGAYTERSRNGGFAYDSSDHARSRGEYSKGSVQDAEKHEEQ